MDSTSASCWWAAGLRGFSSRLTCSRLEQLTTASTSTSAMKFLLALILAREGMSRRTGGRLTKLLEARLMVSNWVHAVISAGNADIRLFDRSKSVMRLKERGSLGGILVMTLLARMQAERGVFLIRWYTA